MVILQQQHSLTGDYTGYNETARPEDPLAEPKRLKQWVVWKYEEEAGRDRPAKVPYNPSTHRRAKPNDPSTWGTYQQALACKEEHEYDGVEFMFTADDIYTGFDFDNCVSPETGVIHPAVVEILGRLNTYWEVSPSGRGVKAIIKGKKPGPRCKTDKTPWGGQIEIYDKKRFFTITGNTVGGRGLPIRDSQDVLDSVYREFFPEPQKPVQAAVRMNTNPAEAISIEEILEKARRAEHGREFVALYDQGDISWCGNDPSKADYRLCKQLAYWLGGDPARMEAVFSESPLGQREKWINRPDYRKTTIDRAIANTSGRYEPEKYKPRPGSTRTRDKLREIHRYAMIGYEWPKNAGGSQSAARDYTAFVVMLRAAWKVNSFEINMSEREMMVAGGFGKRATAAKAIASLVDNHRWCVKVADGSPGMAARYRITPHVDSKRDHALIRDTHPIGDHALIGEKTHPCVDQVRGPLLGKSVLIRNTSPTTDKEYDKNGRRIVQSSKAPVSSVGKVAAWVLDLIHYYSHITGKPAPLEFLEERTNTRRDHLKSRHIRKLIEARLILEDSGGYVTPDNVEVCLDEELEDSGSNAKTRMQKEKNAKDQEISFIHRMRKVGAEYDHIAELTGRSVAEIMDILKPPDEAPSYEDLDRLKEDREIRNADGYIGDLQKADEFGYFPDQKSREPRLISSEEVSKGDVPEDKHPIGCDCIECLFPYIRFAQTVAKDEHHDYASLVT